MPKFCQTYPFFCHHKHSCRHPDFPWKILSFITRNMAADGLTSHEKYLASAARNIVQNPKWNAQITNNPRSHQKYQVWLPQARLEMSPLSSFSHHEQGCKLLWVCFKNSQCHAYKCWNADCNDENYISNWTPIQHFYLCSSIPETCKQRMIYKSVEFPFEGFLLFGQWERNWLWLEMERFPRFHFTMEHLKL